MLARSTVALTNSVRRGAPFQWTADAATKPLPESTSVTPSLPATTLAGAIASSTGPGFATETVAEPLASPTVATTFALPTATARASPVTASIVRTSVSELLQTIVTSPAPFPLTSSAVAVNCWLSPGCRVADGGATTITEAACSTRTTVV